MQHGLQGNHLLRCDPRRQPPEVLAAAPSPFPDLHGSRLAAPGQIKPACCTISAVSRILVVDDEDQPGRAQRINLAARVTITTAAFPIDLAAKRLTTTAGDDVRRLDQRVASRPVGGTADAWPR